MREKTIHLAEDGALSIAWDDEDGRLYMFVTEGMLDRRSASVSLSPGQMREVGDYITRALKKAGK